MSALDTAVIACPYCGEEIEVEIDGSVERQRYVEDCSVCCKPMLLVVECDEDGLVAIEAIADS